MDLTERVVRTEGKMWAARHMVSLISQCPKSPFIEIIRRTIACAELASEDLSITDWMEVLRFVLSSEGHPFGAEQVLTGLGPFTITEAPGMNMLVQLYEHCQAVVEDPYLTPQLTR